MPGGKIGKDEIESFNLADLNVAALDVRLELSTLIPACTLITCTDLCSHDCGRNCNVDCQRLTGVGTCNCNSD